MKTLAFALVLILFPCAALRTCVAQQSSPQALEGLLQAEESPNTTAGIGKLPAGTVKRPKDGVQHPDLDEAWADYEATVKAVFETLRSSVAEQFEAAAAKGDLDAAERWQSIADAFRETGEVPVQQETMTILSAAAADYKKAREELGKAYEAVVKALTMEKRIAEAKVVRDESRAIENDDSLPKTKSFPRKQPPPKPAPTKPAPVFTESIWRWGQHIMVFCPDGIAKEFAPDLGGNPTTGKWESKSDKLVTLRLNNGFEIECVVIGSDSIRASCRSPQGQIHEVLAKKIVETSTTWRWVNGGFHELCGDGCVDQNPAIRWRKDGGRVIITWPGGLVDTLALSPDGSRLTGTNQNGDRVGGERIR
jgi:hypothetical protein